MDFKDLNPSQQEKARACKTPEELLELAKAEGYELTDAELDGIAGGGLWDADDDGCREYLKDCNAWR